MHRYALPIAAWMFVLLGGCGEPESNDRRPDEVEEPGDGPEVPEAPTWDDVTGSRIWFREGFGEARVVVPLDVDGDFDQELIVGGRGLALVDAAARAGGPPRWSVDWDHDPEHPLSGGENVWATDVALIDVNGDGLGDPVVLNSDRDAYAVDAVTGAVLWKRRIDAEFYTTHLAVLDADHDGTLDFFPAGGYHAYSGLTGEPLWAAALPRSSIFVAPARFTGVWGNELLVTTEEDGCIGCPPPDPDDPVIPNVHAIQADGTLLFEAYLEGTIVAIAAADVTGDLRQEAIVGTTEGVVTALNADGVVWSAPLGVGFVRALAAADTDFEGSMEVFAALDVDGSRPAQVFRIDGLTGEVRWSHPVGPQVRKLEVQQLDGDMSLELLVAAGLEYPSSGLALALDVDAEPSAREQWRIDTGMPVDCFAPAEVDDRFVLLVGAADSQVRAVTPDTGAVEWSWSGGGYVFAAGAGDLDGDGLDEVVSGDDRGLVIASVPADGRRLWSRRIDVGAAGQVTAVRVADLDGDGKAEAVASGVRFFQETHRGVIEARGADGTLVAKVLLDGWPWAMQVADLDGEPGLEVVAGVWAADGCTVRAFDAELNPLWRTAVNACEVMSIDVGDVNGDGAVEIAYADTTLSGPPKVALLTGKGELLWSVLPGEQKEDGLWVRAVPGGIVYGGFATAWQGHVTRRDPSGEVVFQALLAPVPDVAHQGSVLAPGAWFGTVVPDQDGDGEGELVVATDAASAILLDGRTGEVRWSTTIEDMTLPSNFRHFAGPVAYVPQTESVPGWIAVGQTSLGRSRASVFALSLAGEVKARIDTGGETHAVAPFRAGEGRTAAAFGAGLGVHALELAKAK